MGRWTNAFGFIQVLYLIVLTISISISTIFIIAKQSRMTEESIYMEYKSELESKGEDFENPELSQSEIYVASYMIKGSSVLVLIASFLIYRSRLLSLPAFTTLKMHQGKREGLAYNPCLQTLDYVFCLSRLRKKTYIEFIIFKKRYRSVREKHAEKASVFILCLWLFVQFYYENLHDLFLTPLYMT